MVRSGLSWAFSFSTLPFFQLLESLVFVHIEKNAQCIALEDRLENSFATEDNKILEKKGPVEVY